ncbi:ubiquitin-conjugating enzyme [Calocera cornea HHB12733]|uniref:E2 ubiquitin-conjugating enzyme n=1 Tax=Calocera cornea HHB12733 TaxID=1353952 RepID=A0A165DBL3_9BASI|nr:ubiquitin-conjugating enzyme [Calocera cornea HHB12733]
MTAVRRITKELATLSAEPIPDLKIEPNEQNILEWTCVLKASADSPYKGGKYQFKVLFPQNFPFKAPDVEFKTKIYHPGIDEEGHICIALLKDDWKPAISIAKVLTTVKDKLNNPSSDDPFNADIAAQLKNDKTAFLKTAKEWTKKYAS